MPVIIPQKTPRAELLTTGQGLIAQTNDLAAISNNTAATAAQKVFGGLVALRAGDIVTNLHAYVKTAGGGTGYARMALYSAAGAQLAISGDANTILTTTTGIVTVPLSAPYTVQADGVYYVCLLEDLATTRITMGRLASLDAAAQVAGVGTGAAAGLRSFRRRSFPSPSATWGATGTGSSFWFGVS
jgi:hypothetical protein